MMTPTVTPTVAIFLMIPLIVLLFLSGVAVIISQIVERRTKRMAQALTNLQVEVTRLQSLSAQILAKTSGEDPAAVQAEADKIAAVNNSFETALNPPQV